MRANKGIYALEAKINEHLASLVPEQRPELGTRRRVRSVAYESGGYFQATDIDGHVDYVSVETASAWLNL